jgi:Zn-finger nucleic acid-binding protein
MNCPIDGTPLVMSDRAGVEIDYCPKCRGVWLDRGELDKIVERSLRDEAPRQVSRPQRRDRDDYRDHRGYDDRPKHYRKKRKSIFEELFDFD